MQKRINYDIRALCLDLFRVDSLEEEQLIEQVLEDSRRMLRADYFGLYTDLLTGKIDYFYFENEPSNAGRSKVEVWTRSARPGVQVQRTAFLKVCDTGELLPMSHHDIYTFSDIEKDSMPDNVTIIVA